MREQTNIAHPRHDYGLTDDLRRYLIGGIIRPGGKLPIFDENGNSFPEETVEACLEAGWAEPAYKRQITREWKLMRLTEKGRELALELAA